jgi:carbon monoxide dehydrogenase subunit G
MKLTGEQTIPANRQRVWDALNDPEILKQCIKGCEHIQKTSDTDFAARILAKVGPVKARFTGKVTLTNLKPPESYTISGQGEGGIAGFAKGKSDIRLSEVTPNETLMAYDVDAQVGGKLAMIGSRLIDATARSMAQEFFDRFVRLTSMPAGAKPKRVAGRAGGNSNAKAKGSDKEAGKKAKKRWGLFRAKSS